MYDKNHSYEYGFRAWDRYYDYMDYDLVNKLKEYIYDELKDSKYYAILAAKAPNKRAKELLLEMSADEKRHAENFIYVYNMLTGMDYKPQLTKEVIVPDYDEALKQRLLAETHDYKRYSEDHLEMINPYLKDLFYRLKTMEAQHAMQIPMLINER